MLGLKDRESNGVFEKKELSYWLMENRRLMRRQESDTIFLQMDSDKNTRISLSEFEGNSHRIKWSSIGRFIDIKEEL
jgi:Ca2+-binding EF-hand superfamily protein